MALKLVIEGDTWEEIREHARTLADAGGQSVTVESGSDLPNGPIPTLPPPVLIGAAPGVAVPVPTDTPGAEPVAPSPPVALPGVASAQTVAGAPELDAEGLPWDERIHTKNRSKAVTGNWKQRRNTDKALVAQVRAELLAAQQGAPVAGAPAPAAVPGAPGVAETIKLASDILACGGTPEGTYQLGAELHALMIANGLPNGQTDLMNRADLAPVIHASLMGIVAARGLPCS